MIQTFHVVNITQTISLSILHINNIKNKKDIENNNIAQYYIILCFSTNNFTSLKIQWT